SFVFGLIVFSGCSNTADIRLLRFWENVKKGGECGYAPPR
ncbi:unnamed protein product, partial [Brassica rapa subsp. trilocularis]